MGKDEERRESHNRGIVRVMRRGREGHQNGIVLLIGRGRGRSIRGE